MSYACLLIAVGTHHGCIKFESAFWWLTLQLCPSFWVEEHLDLFEIRSCVFFNCRNLSQNQLVGEIPRDFRKLSRVVTL